MAERSEAPQSEGKAPEPEVNEDDRRAAAAAANRKRAQEDWEEKKRMWRKMGVPPAMPAKK